MRLRLLSDAGQSLGSSLERGVTLRTVVRLAVPLFADACALDLVCKHDVLERFEVVATDAARARALSQRRAVQPLSRGLQGAVIASGRPALLTERPAPRGALDVERDALWEALGAETMIIVPLRGRAGTLGTLTFVTSTSRRSFGAHDLPFAEELALRAAMAIDNASLYDEARRAVHDRENLLAIVSHDLQSPLSVIMMRAESLLLAGDPACGEDAEAIRRAAQGMHGLIDDLLDLATMDAGTLSMRLAPCALQALIHEVVGQLTPLADQHGIALVRALPEEPVAVQCDADRIMQVLTNLLDNALKFTPRGGTITVSASAAAGEVRIAVQDNGCGITADQLPHVFDRYWRAEPGRRKGAGLGLSICKAIIEAHHARIWAESSPGAGATFYFVLPIDTPATSSA